MATITVRGTGTAYGTPDEATLSATVSKGTYIRSLARDIARALDTVGHVTMLHRTTANRPNLRKGPGTGTGVCPLDC